MKIIDGQKGTRCSEAEFLTFTHKRCPNCDTVKSVTLFYRKVTKTSRGWSWDSQCIDCRRSYCRVYSVNHRDQRNARLRKWRKNNPDDVRRHDRNGRLKFKYGLTAEQVEAMRTEQNGCCAICEKATSRLFVDHCHTKGHVRALICQTCNTFLGWYEKKANVILKFQDYIAKHMK